MVDAGFDPALYDPAVVPNWAAVIPTSPPAYTDYFNYMEREVKPVARGFWGVDDSALDQSCLALAPNPPLHCLDTDWVLENHITTPFFISQDLTDAVAMPRYGPAGLGIFPSIFNFADATARQLNRVVNVGSVVGPAGWPAPGMGEPRTIVPGVLGLNCNTHVILRETPRFMTWTVRPVAGAQPFDLLLDDWINSIAVLSIQADNPAVPGYTSSSCP